MWWGYRPKLSEKYKYFQKFWIFEEEEEEEGGRGRAGGGRRRAILSRVWGDEVGEDAK